MGDKLILTHDGGQQTIVYLPEMNTSIKALFVSISGAVYDNAELSGEPLAAAPEEESGILDAFWNMIF